MGDQPVTRPVAALRIIAHTDIMPRVGFEPTIPVLERAKTVRVLDRAATGIGVSNCSSRIILESKFIFLNILVIKD
jgi:hypothetical protein